jgi:hypothetical protein
MRIQMDFKKTTPVSDQRAKGTRLEDNSSAFRQKLLREAPLPAPACGGRRLRSTAYHKRTTPLVPLASLDLPNRGRRVAYGSMASPAEAGLAVG